MAKSVISSAHEAHLLQIANFGDAMHVCRLAPISYHEAVLSSTQNTSGTALMRKALTLSLGAGTYITTVGQVSGRRLFVNTQASITVSESGNANHLAVVSDTRSALLLVTTITSQQVTGGNTAQVNAFNLEVRDPT